MGKIWNLVKGTVKVAAIVTGLGMAHALTEALFFEKNK
jgi:hypothetical protein